ncbi:MAG: dTMP kinase [Ignavibacteriota bacterium]|jgi:dTMP kinase|nr:MAG: dTMP kinase [Chlorobiota bacterium]MBE7478222.1 dTMP kinase [Ignavibacteriales bacterium]MBL1121547.1 dTMP kinase [Ignavibacteriota bacterium]MBV6419420.1 Thymidylate kinase [Ignavibacteriaceae bacterium]MCE7855219.1 dTMP kinase [Ignavibacteria bacterium CHB3]MEB2296908.1 dTMP kinase [Ignavibacteria bacterium]
MFISFEGIDFSGKSTQIELLKDYLIDNNKKVEILREPGGTEISEKVRKILLDNKNDKMFAEAELFLFSASRAQLVREKIRPYLQKGIYVISDRFHDSSTAYQGFGRGIPLETVMKIHELAIGDTIPDLTLFIDIPVGIANERKKKKSKVKLDRIEVADIEFYNRVRSGYLEIARSEERFKIIDGTQTIETIQNQIISELELIDRR